MWSWHPSKDRRGRPSLYINDTFNIDEKRVLENRSTYSYFGITILLNLISKFKVQKIFRSVCCYHKIVLASVRLTHFIYIQHLLSQGLKL